MDKLKQVLAQEDTVLFIGSGISLWAGLPTWSGMIEELAQFVERSGGKADLIRAEAKRGEPLQAASYGFDRLTKQQIGEFIRAACRCGTARPHDIHQKIVSLGPRCFVTTNYDDLIEQSLRKWQPDRFYKPPVTNRHLTETAEIVHARAIDFIFKPHGDAGDSESIILTREQYRQLLPHGERQAALESVKMLLASRPVVYLGFGLRDPDFIYVRDLLANTYKGGIRDHYAVMADVSEAEIDYWRRNYGIHLISYATTERPDQSRDHSNLLTLLDNLLRKVPVAVATPAFESNSPEVLLALARHAAALARTPRFTPEFSILVHSVKRQSNGMWFTRSAFGHSPVESFLDSGPKRVILTGLPGAGKTYALRRSAARLAEGLNDTCLGETFLHDDVVVPIIVDLKLYRGNLSQLVSEALPSALPLTELVRAFKVKVYLDSFNEMPREYLETGAYEADFQSFLNSQGADSVVIGSRTSDGLEKLDLPVYCLDEIDREAVTGELARLGATIEGRFSNETFRLLQRPFYFQHIASGAITLPKEAHPRDFYRCFFDNTNDAFASRFGRRIKLEEPLAAVAYMSLNRGEEAFPISELLAAIGTSLDALGIADFVPREIANWLVSRSVLLPYLGGRVAFVHQSVTEYLAAAELARRYLNDAQTLKEKLTLIRWDQALFLTLSLLPAEYAKPFLRDVVKADFALALNAAKYLETGRDEVIAELLSDVPKHSHNEAFGDFSLELAIKHGLPVSAIHEPQLRAIIDCGGSLSGAAVIRLVELKGDQKKDEVLKLLLDRRSDYNFCANGVAVALKPFISAADASTIAAWADMVQREASPHFSEDSICGFTSGAAELLSALDLTVVRKEFLPNEDITAIPDVHATILCEVIEKHHSTAALDLAAELLLRGVKKAATSIYFIASYRRDNDSLSWASFTSEHVKCLLEIEETEDQIFGVEALKGLCGARKDLAAEVEQYAAHKTGLAKAALLYCVSPTDLTPVFDALRRLTTLSDDERSKEPLGVLERIGVDWSGKSDLFVDLLRIRDEKVARSLFGGTCPPYPINLDTLDIGAIDWWLEWMLEVRHNKGDQDGWWFLNQMGSLFADQLSQDKRELFVAEFNKADSRYRGLLLNFVMPYFKDTTTDVFNEDTISFLLADLNREDAATSFHGHVLGQAATERFIMERILPLVPGANPPFAQNLRAVLSQVGSRHGRRYVVE